jgi:hypothetical protein
MAAVHGYASTDDDGDSLGTRPAVSQGGRGTGCGSPFSCSSRRSDHAAPRCVVGCFRLQAARSDARGATSVSDAPPVFLAPPAMRLHRGTLHARRLRGPPAAQPGPSIIGFCPCSALPLRPAEDESLLRAVTRVTGRSPTSWSAQVRRRRRAVPPAAARGAKACMRQLGGGCGAGLDAVPVQARACELAAAAARHDGVPARLSLLAPATPRAGPDQRRIRLGCGLTAAGATCLPARHAGHAHAVRLVARRDAGARPQQEA